MRTKRTWFTVTMALLVAGALVMAFDGAALAQKARSGDDGGGPEAMAPRGGPPPWAAGGGWGPGGMRPPGPPPGFMLPSDDDFERAGASDAQRDKIGDIRDAAMREMIRKEADVRIAEIDLRKLVEADKPDRAAVEEAIERIGALRTMMQKTQTLAMLDARDVLTPEQRAKLEKARRSGPHPPEPR